MSTDPNSGVVEVKFITSMTSTPTTVNGVSGTQSTVSYTYGSGVLVSPDEVLTAAHVVYSESGALQSNGFIDVGQNANAPTEMSRIKSIHVNAFSDYTTTAGTAVDFALVHLATPILDQPTMALGSDFSGGTATVTGFPTSSGGQEATATETFTAMNGSVLNSAPLGSDPHGSSGGPVWTIVNGRATVVGDVSSYNGSTGFFKRLTAADVAQIQGWINQDDAGPAGAGQVASNPPPAAAANAPAPSPARSEASQAMAGMHDALAAVAPSLHFRLDARECMSYLSQAIAGGATTFDAAASQAIGLIAEGGGAAHPSEDMAYLAGAIHGYDGGSGYRLAGTLNDQSPGTVTSGNGTMMAAVSGFHVGQHLASFVASHTG
jgi:V8-like Glu-specific endopeptidase